MLLSPWIHLEHYVALLSRVRMDGSIACSIYPLGLGFDYTTDGGISRRFDTIELAKQAADKKLIELGYTFLDEKRWQNYLLLK